MRKVMVVMIVALLLNPLLANAITQQEIGEAEGLIDSGVGCRSLSDVQLEIIGEYYMEQMHSGEAHELMHKMMGLEEGSDAERQFHVNMAKTVYCGESGGMMGGNMMVGGGYWPGYWNPVNLIYLIPLIGLIILLYVWLSKPRKPRKKRGGGRK